jgi:hypothetical protein
LSIENYNQSQLAHSPIQSAAVSYKLKTKKILRLGANFAKKINAGGFYGKIAI